MSEQTIEVDQAVAPVQEASAADAPVSACSCSTEPAPSESPLQTSNTAPSHAPQRAAARLLTRLPLWARVAGGVALWALVYHYWLPIATWFTHDVLHLGDSAFASALGFFIYD